MDIVETFRALGDPVRLRMIQMLLQDREVFCTAFEDIFPIGKSTISYHVKALKFAGLITVRKEKRYYVYSLRRAAIDLELPGLLAAIESLPRQPLGSESPPPVSSRADLHSPPLLPADAMQSVPVGVL